MVEKIINYKTSDGGLFDTEQGAWTHENDLTVKRFTAKHFSEPGERMILSFLRLIAQDGLAANALITNLYKRSGSNMVLGTTAPKPAPEDRCAFLS